MIEWLKKDYASITATPPSIIMAVTAYLLGPIVGVAAGANALLAK